MKTLTEYITEKVGSINDFSKDPILSIVKKYLKSIQTRRDTWDRVVKRADFDAIYNLKDTDDTFWFGKGNIVSNLKEGQKLKGPFVNFRLEDEEDAKVTIYLDDEFEFEGWDSNGVEFGWVDGDSNGTVGPIFVDRNAKEVLDDTVFAIELSKSYAQKIFDLIKK